MAFELRLVFIIIGALILGALLLHGLWTVRKNAGQPRHRYYDESAKENTDKADGFDELGVGAVRVVKKADNAAASNVKPEMHQRESLPRTPLMQSDEVQAELPFDEPQEPRLHFAALDEVDAAEMSFEPEPITAAEEPVTSPEEPAEVLILYVLLPENKEMKGPDLLSLLLTLGFKYGDMDIFHRHQDSAGSGAVLFSLANMFNPGTFDLENMNKLATRGVSLFMMLPGPGEPLQNFNLMHNAAKKLAEEFGGQVLDGQRSVLTVQTVRHYVDKIREFQRQQLIHG